MSKSLSKRVQDMRRRDMILGLKRTAAQYEELARGLKLVAKRIRLRHVTSLNTGREGDLLKEVIYAAKSVAWAIANASGGMESALRAAGEFDANNKEES